jgi:isopenicillin N synthase-like dioxygenase
MDDTIPILDLAPYRAGEPGADRRLADELRRASEDVGFYFIRNHDVDHALIDATFAQAAPTSTATPATTWTRRCSSAANAPRTTPT